jgi:hypothetical protein
VELFHVAPQPAVENQIVTILWIVGGVGLIVAVGLATLTARRGDGKDRDLGSVSSQWVFEHSTTGPARDPTR